MAMEISGQYASYTNAYNDNSLLKTLKVNKGSTNKKSPGDIIPEGNITRKIDTHKTMGQTCSSEAVKKYTQTLQEKYSYFNTSSSIAGVPTTISVSPAFLKKCAADPEKAKYLEENLKVLPDCVKSLKDSVGKMPGAPIVTYATFSIDEDGNISATSGSTNDPDGKIARENAEKKAKEQKEATKKAAKKREQEKKKRALEQKEKLGEKKFVIEEECLGFNKYG